MSTPFLQLSGTVFQGTHQSLLGTELIFTEDKGWPRRYPHGTPSLIPHLSDPQDQTRRKVSHLSNTSQRIRFKQVEVQPKGAPAELPPGPSAHGKGKSASNKKKPITVDDDDVMDQITGNIEPGGTSPLRRRLGKGKGKRGSVSEPSQSQPGDMVQSAAPEEMPPAPGAMS
jgi:hypothetical protein